MQFCLYMISCPVQQKKENKMKYTIEFYVDNAAFEDDNLELEIIRILREEAIRIEHDGLEQRKIRDINGNTIGTSGLKNEK